MDDDRPGSLSQQVAWRLRQLREERRLPYTELAERLAKIGQPIPVLGLRRIERGERRVDVDELAALALALNVPPLLLLFPIDHEDWVAVAPNWVIRTWNAAEWFTGQARLLPTGDGNGDEIWTNESAQAYWLATIPFVHRREHAEFIKRYGKAAAAGDEVEVQRVLAQWREARAEIRQKGFTPPEMEGLLADLEDM